MNATTWTIYREYLDRVNDPASAASLTLADAMQTARDDQPESPLPDQPLTVPEVAKLLRVRPDKVLAWIRSGRLRGYNVAEKEQGRPKYRVNPSDLDDFAKRRCVIQPAPTGRPTGSHRRIPKVPGGVPVVRTANRECVR
jgi:excisionase family DNA binding protein